MEIKDYLTEKECCDLIVLDGSLKWCGYHNIETKSIEGIEYYKTSDLLNQFIKRRKASTVQSLIPELFKCHFYNHIYLKDKYTGNERYISIINMKDWNLLKNYLKGELHAVYILFKNNEIIYVGRTANVSKRINAHMYKKEFDYLNILIYDTIIDVEKNEVILIRKLKPKLNKRIK